MIKSVHYGQHKFAPWYQNPGYIDMEAKTLKSYRSKEPQTLWKALSLESGITEMDIHVCPNCFLYSSNASDIVSHQRFCHFKSCAPGKLVYQGEDFSIRYLQYAENSDDSNPVKLYMQAISLFGRMFLETKSICFALDGFEFFVAYDTISGLPAGFFSKEKQSWHNYNLACIVVFPPFQRRGLGQLLIGYSYYLSRKAGNIGGPEHPLSKHGHRTYTAYWKQALCQALISMDQAPKTLRALCEATGIAPSDVVTTLSEMGALKHDKKRIELDLAAVARYTIKHPPRLPFDATKVTDEGGM